MKKLDGLTKANFIVEAIVSTLLYVSIFIVNTIMLNNFFTSEEPKTFLDGIWVMTIFLCLITIIVLISIVKYKSLKENYLLIKEVKELRRQNNEKQNSGY